MSAGSDSPAPAVPASLLAEIQRTLALLLAPFAPYLAHELWEMLGEKGNLLRGGWPKYDPVLAKEEEIEIDGEDGGGDQFEKGDDGRIKMVAVGLRRENFHDRKKED